MDSVFVYELIGYVASVLVAVSLMMSRIVPLRIVNMIGAATFAVYGYLIGSWPVAGMNAFIVLINVYYLTQIYRSSEFFRILPIDKPDAYLSAFLKFYQEDIATFYPDFKDEAEASDHGYFVLRNMAPAGLILGRVENGCFHVSLDYATPQYRDFKVAAHLWRENRQHFTDEGITEIRSRTRDPHYAAYLRKIGFEPLPGEEQVYGMRM
ncbi:inner membrane protein [Cyclonatronum proteinivorum]|uniref:Inner membrane protein n=1 Tax=Cyclonatronum proteinivorum TaxID=1457365 RepID=A0A345UPR9_9BACT|nr:YgjV family protein [Cyclonatronum proteinivorum]AXJ02471.1 inner membrane protein [Cyclonatronum proteinivorum]